MSTRSSSTYHTSDSSRLKGVPSGVILFVAILTPFVLGAVDVAKHGHFSCDTLVAATMSEVENNTNLKMYVSDQTDFAGQPENGTVKCDCTNKDRKIVLTGKVTNKEIRQGFSDAAAAAVGTNIVDNQIEICNIEALEKLKELLATPPTNMHLNYEVRDRCTIRLTGDLPDPALKEKVGAMVADVEGVRSVVNLLGMENRLTESFVVRNIYFDFNKWTIRPESKAGLDESAQKIEEFLADEPNGTVRIVGHTDSIASTQYNQWLSEKRAQAVLEALVSNGIAADRLKAEGKGESQLLVRNDDTPEKRAENRRIEFRLESK